MKKRQSVFTSNDFKRDDDKLKIKEKKSEEKKKDEEIKKFNLIGLIAEEGSYINLLDCVTGFVLGGIAEINRFDKPNFFVVTKATRQVELEEAFREMMRRDDMDIILIAKPFANRLKHIIRNSTATLPMICEIPTKETPFDDDSDPLLNRARGMFAPNDVLEICSGPYSKTLHPQLRN